MAGSKILILLGLIAILTISAQIKPVAADKNDAKKAPEAPKVQKAEEVKTDKPGALPVYTFVAPEVEDKVWTRFWTELKKDKELADAFQKQQADPMSFMKMDDKEVLRLNVKLINKKVTLVRDDDEFREKLLPYLLLEDPNVTDEDRQRYLLQVKKDPKALDEMLVDYDVALKEMLERKAADEATKAEEDKKKEKEEKKPEPAKPKAEEPAKKEKQEKKPEPVKPKA